MHYLLDITKRVGCYVEEMNLVSLCFLKHFEREYFCIHARATVSYNIMSFKQINNSLLLKCCDHSILKLCTDKLAIHSFMHSQ